MKGMLNNVGWQNFLTLSAVYGVLVASASFVTGVYAKQQVVTEIKEFRKQYDPVGFYVNVLLELKRQEDPKLFLDACRRAQRLQSTPVNLDLCKE